MSWQSNPTPGPVTNPSSSASTPSSMIPSQLSSIPFPPISSVSGSGFTAELLSSQSKPPVGIAGGGVSIQLASVKVPVT